MLGSFAVRLRFDLALAVALVAGEMVGCAEGPAEQSIAVHASAPVLYFGVPPGSSLDDYFQAYCGEAGNLGIGIVAWHTYLYKFQERLAKNKDRELERLYVLYHLYREVDEAIRDLENDVIRVGIADRRPISMDERKAMANDLAGRIVDLNRFDPGDPEKEILRDKERLQNARNTKSH